MREFMPSSQEAKRPDIVSLATICMHLVIVFAPVYLAAASGIGWWLVPLWLWFGITMNGVLNLMHEAAHYHVFHGRTANDLLGRWILGPLSLADFDSYRQRHWNHHRHLGDATDPKLTYHMDIRGNHLLGLFVRCLTLLEAAKRSNDQVRSVYNDSGPEGSTSGLVRAAAVHAIFFGSLLARSAYQRPGDLRGAVAAGLAAYGLVYLYGVASLTVFMASLRGLAEHQIGPDESALVGSAALRNFTCGPFTGLVLGAYGFSSHATHHRQPGVPYYRLRSRRRNSLPRIR